MKCVCGYENRDGEYDHEADKLVEDKNKEEFQEVEGLFTIESGDYHNYQKKVHIYACPKCWTLQMLNP